ncbi:MAG: radical SAM protein [Nitrospirota bacterium]|nr:radical SAM protein [Nitrospirota bacterium]
MGLRSKLVQLCTPLLRNHSYLKNGMRALDTHADLIKHSAARVFPQIIRPDPREIFITLTANCNLRCVGCRYGRDFMPGAQLPWAMVRDLLDDSKQCDIRSIRLYGGEPLLHKDLPRIVEHAVNLGLHPWVTTNGILLKEKIDDLYQAGLREVDVGFYGLGEDYNTYVQRKDQFVRMEAGVAYLRDRYGMDIKLRFAWVLMRPTCSLRAVEEVCRFTDRYATSFSVNLIHYSLPYFTEGPNGELQFRLEDRPAIEAVVAELVRLKQLRPELVGQSVVALRSIPDWLLKGPAMKVPCERYRLIWVGADGTVQLCYVTFKLGNLHEKRLSQMLFTPEHRQASRDAFALKCPNCHCAYSNRIETHAPSRLKYL